MIYLITGRPGHGKTLYTISKFMEEKFPDREIYYKNIRGLKDKDWTEYDDPTKWQDLPDGSVLLVDEVQDYYPSVGNVKSQPDHVMQFAKHRHKGLDFVFITQKPGMLNHYIRGLVDKHLHVARHASGAEKAEVFEWNQICEKPDDQYERKKAFNKKGFDYPAEFYDSYKSAELHTHKKKTPRIVIMFWLIILAFILIVAKAGYSIYGKSHNNNEENNQEISTDVENDTSINGASPSPTSSSEKYKSKQSGEDAEVRERDYFVMLAPRIPDLPYTAPIYDELVKAQNVPSINCIAGATKCICHTEQSTKLNISESSCRRFAENGHYEFYRKDKNIKNQRLPSKNNAENNHIQNHKLDNIQASLTQIGVHEIVN